MILVDTSVWVNHLKVGDPDLVGWLRDGVVAVHPFVEGELLLAGAPIEVLLGGVARVPEAPHDEVRAWVTSLGDAVRGVGWVDAHLAYSARVGRLPLATYDRRLRALAAMP